MKLAYVTWPRRYQGPYGIMVQIQESHPKASKMGLEDCLLSQPHPWKLNWTMNYRQTVIAAQFQKCGKHAVNTSFLSSSYQQTIQLLQGKASQGLIKTSILQHILKDPRPWNIILFMFLHMKIKVQFKIILGLQQKDIINMGRTSSITVAN